MSVQTEIDRLAAAKTAIKTAIEGKGVTVPDATTLDGFASLIEAIESGGGGGGIAMGEITPTDAAAAQLEIHHGLGTPPEVFFICAEFSGNAYSYTPPRVNLCAYAIKRQNNVYSILSIQSNKSTLQNSYGDIVRTTFGTSAAYYIVVNEETAIWGNRGSTSSTGGGFQTEAPYFWIAIKEIQK